PDVSSRPQPGGWNLPGSGQDRPNQGVSPLQPAMSAYQPPTARSLRGDGGGDDNPTGVSDSPIYDSVRSAWFKRGGSLDWSSPADEGWRRAAQALRTVESAASQTSPAAPAPAATQPAPTASPSVGAPTGRVGPAPWTSGGVAGPSAQPGHP